jgi:hypothetical protein
MRWLIWKLRRLRDELANSKEIRGSHKHSNLGKPFDGVFLFDQSASINKVFYLFSLDIGINENTLVIVARSLPDFEIRLPIQQIEIGPRRFLFFPYCYLSSSFDRSLGISMSERLVRKIDKLSNGKLGYGQK